MADHLALPLALDRRFEAVVLFTDRAAELRPVLLEVLDAGLYVTVVTADPAAVVLDALAAAGAGDRLLVAGLRGGDLIGDPAFASARLGLSDVDLRAVGQVAVERLVALGLEATVSSRSAFERDVIIEVTPIGDGTKEASADADEVARLVGHARVSSRSSLREVAAQAAADVGITDLHVWAADGRVELATLDEGDVLRHALLALWHRGVSSSGVLVVADADDTGARGCSRAAPARRATVACAAGDHEHGHHGAELLTAGPAAVPVVLADQAHRRAARQLPTVAPEPGWELSVTGFDREREPVHQAWFVLADGEIGSSGAPTVADESGRPWVLATGVYHREGPETHLLEGPHPSRFAGRIEDQGFRRVLDLRSGVVAEAVTTDGGRVETVRFSSLARPGTLVERISAPAALDPPTPFSPDGQPLDEGSDGSVRWVRTAATTGGIAAASAAGRWGDVYERITVYSGDPERLPDHREPAARARLAAEAGFDHLLTEHRRRWAERWRNADIVIGGDPRLQAAVRFALFHLMASARDHDEAAVGARGLTGHGYRGHVFWDADTFVLPFLAATHPPSARAMLEYRVRRLPMALANARAAARRGARFPWESARTGVDVTPTTARDRTGRLIPIRTGQLEDHIVADIAWASSWYEEWTGDEAYRRGDGKRILVETARYWASRIRAEPDGRAHIYGVIGPDEYHEPVDDDAYTNVMARWNLRRAAAAVDELGDDATSADERARWLELASALVDGYDSDTGIYEQCADFSSLEPLIVAEIAPRRPIAADYLLGISRVRRAQIIKQPDVLMLHHLVPDEVARGSLEPNLRFYEPRTAHGSSLSPAIHAGLFARARDFDQALDALAIACRIDLDDLTGTTASGLHLATMGGLWQALAMGFAGLRPRNGRLHLDPLLPRSWSSLEVHVQFRGSPVVVRRDRARLHVTAGSPVDIVLDDRTYNVGEGGLVFVRRYDTWGLAR